jgi:oligoendopeptidase F
VTWNLSDLFKSEAELSQALDEVGKKVDAFAAAYRARVASLSPEELDTALRAFESAQEILDRAFTYAFLSWSTNTEDAPRGALLQKVRERYTEIAQRLIFFDLELIDAAAERGQSLWQAKALERYAHFLETLALRRKHVLGEPEEKIIAEKSVTGVGAWTRYFDEVLGAARFNLDGESLTEQDILSKLYENDRSLRQRAALAFTEGLKSQLRTLTYVFNTLLAEKASDDKLRNYPHWLAARNLSNEISDESVNALVGAVTDRFDLVRRYYSLKKKLLGLDELQDYDRYAPVFETDSRYTWQQAKEIVISAYGDFSPRMADIVTRFFKENWIDAPIRPGKRGGAFSHSAVPEVHPYILMNFTGNSRDVQTLAHELGHGVHQYLARGKGSLQCNTPLTTAETASVFGEMLVFRRLLEMETDDRQRLAMLVGKIDDTTATVFRQVAMNRFEERIHHARRDEGELPAERFSKLWIETQGKMFQGSVTLGSHYQIWWSYIPHFLHTPGYVYAYAFGELLVLALFAVYKKEPDGFAERYLSVLEAGGSDWPHNLLARLGVDLRDPEFWKFGLLEIETVIEQAEALWDRLS